MSETTDKMKDLLGLEDSSEEKKDTSIDEVINNTIEIPIKWKDNIMNLKGKQGGAIPGAGRKTRAEQFGIVENLDANIDKDDAMEAFRKMVIDDKYFPAMKLYLEYRFGKPRESLDITTNGKDFNMPVIQFFNTTIDETDASS